MTRLNKVPRSLVCQQSPLNVPRGEKGRVIILSEHIIANADHVTFHNTTRSNGPCGFQEHLEA